MPPCSLFISLFNSFGRTAIDIILRTRTAFRQYLEHHPSESSRRPAWWFAVLHQEACQCAVTAAVGINNFRMRDFAVRRFIKLELFGVAEMWSWLIFGVESYMWAMGIFPFVSSVWSAGCGFPAQSAKRRRTQTKADFHLFLPPFSSHSVRHRLPLLGYPLSGKSTHQLSNYKRKNYWIYKLSIYFLDLIRRAFMYRLLDDRQFRMHGLGRSSSAWPISFGRWLSAFP